MLVALASYIANDPGFSSTGSGEHGVQNRIGPFGAWLASLLFFLFGRPAYLFPIMLAVACFVMFRQPPDEDGRTRFNTAGGLGGFTLMPLARGGPATLLWDAGALPAAGGGAVGPLGKGLGAAGGFLRAP